ncbi:MAG TPA: hypothetical protein VN668_03915 [Stellaceae bacterium]|nr:hypothetical protein [Stellaceae bacterium]
MRLFTVFPHMQQPSHYRAEAARARRLARDVGHPEAQEALERMAHEYEALAAELERGSADMTSPEPLSAQQERSPVG